MLSASIRTASDAIQAAIRNYQGNATRSWGSGSYHHFRRIQKLDIDISNNVATCSDPNKSLTMIADATGLEICRRGDDTAHGRQGAGLSSCTCL